MTRKQLIKTIESSLIDNGVEYDDTYEIAESIATDLDTEYSLIDEEDDEDES